MFPITQVFYLKSTGRVRAIWLLLALLTCFDLHPKMKMRLPLFYSLAVKINAYISISSDWSNQTIATQLCCHVSTAKITF